MKIRSIMVLHILIYFLSCTPNQFDNYLIQPGHSVGDFKLLKSHKKDFLKQFSLQFYSEQGFYFNFKQDLIVYQVATNNVGFYTAENVKVGDSVEKVVNTYGKGNESEVFLHYKSRMGAGAIARALIYESGIAFVFEDGRVTYIIVMLENTIPTRIEL